MNKTTITIVVLSEKPIDERLDIVDVVNECIEGDFVMHSTGWTDECVSNEEMIQLLIESESDPEFFQLSP